ncbi:MAG: hypothetical protein G8345_17225, partial [Magnetococcales bacterium]|nr:hypothetical protein [Magnetococcales bacterium]
MSRFPESGGDDFVAARSLGVLAGNLVVNRTVNGWVGVGNSYDSFRFTLDSTSLVQLLLSGLEADASLYLMDGAGTLVLASSTNSGLLAESIRQTLPIGSYQVRIARVTNNTSYQLNLVTHADLGGDDTTHAAEIGLLAATRKSCQEWIGTGDSGDYYRFIVAASGQLLLELSGLTADANLQLLDGSGLATLAASSLTGASRERIDQSLAAGTYYARVTGPANTTTRYDLNLAVRDPLLPGNDFLVQQGSINSTNKSDYFPIFLANTSNLVLLLGDLEQNANLFLYNSSGNTLLSSSSRLGTSEEQIMIQLAAGHYQVRVSQGSTTVATDYSLVMLARRDTGFDTPAQVFNPITLSSQSTMLNGWVGKNDTHDYGGFIITETGNVTLQLVNLDADANLYLYNGNGSSLLASSILSGLTTDSIVQSLGMGSYMVRVSRSGSYDTRYSLLLQAEADTGEDRPEQIQTVYQITSSPLELSGWVGAGDSFDYYRFGIDSPGHATLSLVDAESSQLLDSFSGHLQAGTYTYAVRRQGTSNTYYTLSVANEPDTNGNTPYTPTDLGTYVDTPLVYSNWIGDEDLHDYYHFAVSTLGPVSVTLSNLSQEADLFLFDAYGATLLATPQITQNTYKSLVAQLQAGDYLARVSRQGTHNSIYTLTVAQQLESQFNSNVELSDAVTNYSGWLGPGDTLDTLNFVVRNTGHVALSLLNFEADANLYLFGSNGSTLLATSLASETTTDAIHLQLTPATYQARMSR